MISQNDILKEWRKLQRIRQTPEICFNILLQSKSDSHYNQARKLQRLILENQDAHYELLFSGQLDEKELLQLLDFGGHGGSLSKHYNLHWAPFIQRVRERQHELPQRIQDYLNWLLEVHKY